MATIPNIPNTIISLVILILLIFLGAIKIDAEARFELADDEVEDLREIAVQVGNWNYYNIDSCINDKNWNTNYNQDKCHVDVKCHVLQLILSSSYQAMFNDGFNSAINIMHHDDLEKVDTLAVQYGPNVCSTRYIRNCRPLLPENFTIHGLWPNKEGISPVNRTFNSSLLYGQLLQNLTKYWPSLRNIKNSNNIFWSHEWVKHGAYYQQGDQVEYFQKGVDLFLKDEITRALTFLNQTKRGKKYRTKAILKKQALKGRTLFCQKNSKKNITLLIEIRFCMKTKSEKFTGCTAEQIGCGEAFYVFEPS